MSMIADILLVAGALGAGIYCMALSRRLNRFNSLEGGMGNAIAVLSSQVDELTKALEHARSGAQDSSRSLTELTERSETVAQRLELLVASMHDIPEPSDKLRREVHEQAEPTDHIPFVRHQWGAAE